MYAIIDKKELGKRITERRASQKEKQIGYCKSHSAFIDEMSKQYPEQIKHRAKADKGESGDRRTLARWEAGGAYPDVGQLLAICNLLQCDVDYLIGNQEVPLKSVKAAAELLNLDYDNAERLRMGEIESETLNRILSKAEFSTICGLISRLSVYSYLDNSLLSHYKAPLMKRITLAYKRVSLSTTAYDDFLQEYKKALSAELSKDNTDYLMSFVSDDVKRDIDNRAQDSQIAKGTPQYYDLFVDTLAEFTIEPLNNQKAREVMLNRICGLFAELVGKCVDDDMIEHKKALIHAATKQTKKSR